MSNLTLMKPLGEILKDAGLITAPQIEVALHDQIYYQDMRLGEILALRGWIEQKTVDFFAEEWIQLINQKRNQPLGFYLKKAALLTDEQIQLILVEQNQNLLRFGTTAVIKGLVKQNTIDFFLKNLFPSQANKTQYMVGETSKITNPQLTNKIRTQTNEQQTEYISQEDITYWATLSEQKLSGF